MYEESNRSVFNGSILSLILRLLLLAIFVFILCWLFTRNSATVIKETNSSFASNISTMKEAAFEYFTTDKLPNNIGGTEKLSLTQMLNQKLLIDFTDNGKECDTNDSYVQATKTADENYALKVSLTCDKQSDFIVTTIEKQNLNVTVDCAACHDADAKCANSGSCNNTDSDKSAVIIDDDDDEDKKIIVNNNNPSSTGQSRTTKSNNTTSTNYNYYNYDNNSAANSASVPSNTSSNTNNTTTTTTTTTTNVTTTVKTYVNVIYSCSTCASNTENETSTVTANYVDDKGNTIADSVVTTGVVGSAYTTNAKIIDGYLLTEMPTNASGNYTKEAITVTYVYTKANAQTSLVIVKYVDESGNEIASSNTLTGKVGDAYTTSAKTISGYTLKTTPANANGTYATNTITVTYVYKKNVNKVTYYKVVKYGPWQNGSKPGMSGDDMSGYETTCSTETTYDYCKKYTNHYYSTSYVSEASSSNYSYTIQVEDISPSNVLGGSLNVINRSYFTSASDYQAYLNYYHGKPISMVNDNPSAMAYITDVNTFMNGSLTSANFSYSIGSAYLSGNYYYVPVNISIKNKNITPYYAANLGKNVWLVPVKFDLQYVSTKPSDCVNDTAANAGKYSGYEKLNQSTTNVCKYRSVEYKWVPESELNTYLNNGWTNTGITKTV